MRNIGNAFVHLGQLADAVQSYETILGGCQNFHTAFNLIVCYYALGDTDKMRTSVQKLVGMSFQDRFFQGTGTSATHSVTMPEGGEGHVHLNHESRTTPMADLLGHELRVREKQACCYILTACRLVAPILQLPGDYMFGYKFIIDTLRTRSESCVQ